MSILAEVDDVTVPFNWPETTYGWLFFFLVVSLVVAGIFSAMNGWVTKVGSGPKNTVIIFVVLIIAVAIAASQGRV